MSVDQRKVVDAIGVEKATGDLCLTITDHLDWADALGHMYTLQEKINDYLGFLEAGQISETYPGSEEKKKKILIYFKHPLPDGDALRFLQHAQEVVEKAGFSLQYKVYETGG